MQIEVLPFPSRRASRDLESSSSSWYREADTLANGEFPQTCKCPLQKGDFYSVFRVSPASAVSRKLSAQNILYDKEVYFEMAYSVLLHLPSFLLSSGFQRSSITLCVVDMEKYKMALNKGASTQLIRVITKDIINLCIIHFSLEHKLKRDINLNLRYMHNTHATLCKIVSVSNITS